MPAAAGDQRLHQPVSGLLPLEVEAGLVGSGLLLDPLAEGDQLRPAFGQILDLDAGRLEQVGIDVEDRRRNGEREAVALALPAAEGGERRIVAELVSAAISRDQVVDIRADPAIDEKADLVDAVEGDVG